MLELENIMLELENINVVHRPDDNKDVGVVKDNKANGDCKIMILNDDCLKHVFSFLSQKELIGVERVCKRWQSTSLDSWSTIKHVSVGDILYDGSPVDLIIPYKYSFSAALECVFKRCGDYVKTLHIQQNYHGCYRNVDEGINISMIAQYCIALQHLNIYCSNITVNSGSFEPLLPHLQKLEIDLWGSGLVHVLKMCPNIRSLSMPCNSDFTASCLRVLNLEMLEEFSILNYRDSVMELKSILYRTKNLKSLKVHFAYHINTVSRKDYLWIFNSFPNLEVLSFKCGKFPNADETPPLTGISKKLLSLNIKRNYLVNDLILKEICSSCLKLENVNITRCSISSVGINAIVRLPNIKKLSMSCLDYLRDDHLELLACNGKLTHLDLKQNFYITDIGCSKIIVSCNDLEYLDISACKHITGATVKSAKVAMKYRTNNKKLKLLVGATGVSKREQKRLQKEQRRHSNYLLTLDFSYLRVWYTEEDTPDEDEPYTRYKPTHEDW